MAMIANFFIGVYNKIVEFVKKAIGYLPDWAVTDGLREFAASEDAGTKKMLSTNSAEEYRKAQLEEQKAKKEKEKANQTDDQPDATPVPPEATPAPTPDAAPVPSNVVTREEFDKRRKEKLEAKRASEGLTTREQREIMQINRRQSRQRRQEKTAAEDYIKRQQNKVPAQEVQPPAGAATGKVTVINNIDQSNNSRTASQTNSFNPMGVGAPAGL
jgi:hypothetical protein